MFNWLTSLFTSSNANLNQYSVLNHQGLTFDVSGFSPGLISTYSGFIQNKLAQLKNINFGKWEYQGDELDWERLEQFLFFFGKCVIWKVDNTFLIDNFTVKKWGSNSVPSVVSVKRKTKEKMITHQLTVDVNCVIFYNDSSFLLGKTFLGIVYRLWPSLHQLERINYELFKNTILSNNKITVPIETSDEVVRDLNESIMSPDVILRLATKSGLVSTRNENVDGVLLRVEDRTSPLITAYKFFWQKILEEMGVRGNPDVKKERMVGSEIDNNNQLTDLFNKSCLKMREKSIKTANSVFGTQWSVELFSKEEENEIDNEIGNEEVNNE